MNVRSILNKIMEILVILLIMISSLFLTNIFKVYIPFLKLLLLFIDVKEDENEIFLYYVYG